MWGSHGGLPCTPVSPPYPLSLLSPSSLFRSLAVPLSLSSAILSVFFHLCHFPSGF